MSRALRLGAVPAVAAALLLPAGAARAQDPVPADPAITIVAPAAGTVVGVGVPLTMTAQPTGDVASVYVAVDGIPTCLLSWYFSCFWKPGPADVGEHVIAAQVTDKSGRTADATTTFRVERLAPAKVRAKVQRKRRGKRAWRLTTKGALALPAGLTREACGGRATVTVLRGARTLVDRTTAVGRTCTFRSRVSLLVPRRTKRVRVKVVYEGGSLLAPRAAPVQTIRLK